MFPFWVIPGILDTSQPSRCEISSVISVDFMDTRSFVGNLATHCDWCKAKPRSEERDNFRSFPQKVVFPLVFKS